MFCKPPRFDYSVTLQSANLRPTAILHYDSSAAVLPISQGGPVLPDIGPHHRSRDSTWRAKSSRQMMSAATAAFFESGGPYLFYVPAQIQRNPATQLKTGLFFGEILGRMADFRWHPSWKWDSTNSVRARRQMVLLHGSEGLLV